MKLLLFLLFSTVLTSSIFGQSLRYEDKKIYKDDAVVFDVLEIYSGRVLEERDYVESDSSQYYDYMIRSVSGSVILYLSAENRLDKSDAHYPNRFASHVVSTDYKRRLLYGTVTENQLTVLTDNADYRTFLIEYLIEFGLISETGIVHSKVADFREIHRP